MDHAYWGPYFDNDVIDALLTERQAEITDAGCTWEFITDAAELCRRTASAIADGKVIGWFQGRMEWGPRALGNRSILADPRRADMKELLNRKIKRRESFRPFAPSILDKYVSEWFEEDDDVPFMMQVSRSEAKRDHYPRSYPCGRFGPSANRVPTYQSALLFSHRQLPRYHRGPNGAEHLVQ